MARSGKSSSMFEVGIAGRRLCPCLFRYYALHLRKCVLRNDTRYIKCYNESPDVAINLILLLPCSRINRTYGSVEKKLSGSPDR
jgi:hypothetical protein